MGSGASVNVPPEFASLSAEEQVEAQNCFDHYRDNGFSEEDALQKVVSLVGITGSLINGKMTCVEKVQAALDLMAAKEGDYNACAEILSETALQQAAAADVNLSNGGERRPLEGMPILVKVNIDIAGTLSTASMPGLSEWRPESTAPVAQALIDAGAIVIGKTNMPEAAFGPYGFSPVHGITKNPRNVLYTTTGSSAGTAAGIAAGYCRSGLGSDTGGSLRMPAEACGIVGMRPSRGRYSGSGVVPCNVSHDTVGAMGLTVKDVAALDAVMADGENKLEDYLPANLSGLSVGVDSAMYDAAAPGHQRAIDLAVASLEASGATTKRCEFWKSVVGFKHEKAIDYRIKGLEDYIASHPTLNKTADEILEKSYWTAIPAFYKILGPFGKYNGSDLIMVNDIPKSELEGVESKFQNELKEYELKYTNYLKENGYDFMITPVFHGAPPKQRTADEFSDFKNVRSDFGIVLGASSGISALNELSIPSMTLPTKAIHDNIDGNGDLPCGILVYGLPKEDKKLIEICLSLEMALAK